MITPHWITDKKVLAEVNAVYLKYPAKVANRALNYMECNNMPILSNDLYDTFLRETTDFGIDLLFVNPTNPKHVEVVCKFVLNHPELCKNSSDVFEPVTMIKVNPW